MSEGFQVEYEAAVHTTMIPFRYLVTLAVDGIPTGVRAIVWTRARAGRAMSFMAENGMELINKYGVAAELAEKIYARKREEAMAKVQVGDTVKLLVDIGQYKKGRICKVVQVAEPSFYEARGSRGWVDEEHPVMVSFVHSPQDIIALGPKDSIPLRRGEFGPLDQDVDE